MLANKELTGADFVPLGYGGIAPTSQPRIGEPLDSSRESQKPASRLAAGNPLSSVFIAELTADRQILTAEFDRS